MAPSAIISNRMSLEDYLQALKTCPDSELIYNLGVYDNWFILLKANFEELTKHLEESNQYLLTGKRGVEIYFFINTASTTQIEVYNFLKYRCGRDYGYDWNEEDIKKQSSEYNMSMELHTLSIHLSLNCTHWIREIANVIDDIGKYITTEKIPACFPNSIGWKYRKEKTRKKDCIRRLVYNQPI